MSSKRDEHGQTPLMFAVAAGHVEVVRMLCAAGANVHAMRERRWRSLDLCLCQAQCGDHTLSDRTWS